MRLGQPWIVTSSRIRVWVEQSRILGEAGDEIVEHLLIGRYRETSRRLPVASAISKRALVEIGTEAERLQPRDGRLRRPDGEGRQGRR